MRELVISGYSEAGQASLRIGNQEIIEQNPSFCCIVGDKIVALNELGGKGKICLYTKKEGVWRLMASKELAGGGMCHLSYSPKHRLLFGACYETGHIFSIEVLGDGFGEVTHFLKLEANKQDGISRAHCVQMDPSEQYLYAVNIHTDTIWCFSVTEGKLEKNDVFEKLVLPAQSGPRHIVFHPNRPIAYIMTEYANVIFVVAHTATTGQLEIRQQISSIPPDFEGISYGATCVISADGRYLYGANRGHNSVIVFKILEDGCIEKQQIVSCQGDWPRDLCLSEDGEQLWVCNQRSHEVVSIYVNKETGMLDEVGEKIAFHEPSFVQEIHLNEIR